MTITVLHVVEAFSTGIIQSIRTICRALEGEVDFHILYGRRPETPADVERQYPAAVGFTPWAAAGRAIDPGRDWRAVAELKETVARIRPDLIHAHSSKAGAYARLAYPRGQVPVLYSPRGYSFLQLDKGLAGRTAFRGLEWLLGRLPHITVGCGLGEYSLARTVARRAVLIPNMINPADFPTPDLGLRPDPAAPLRIAMAGGIRPQKNFPLFCAVARAFEGRDLHFLWLGGGEIPAGVRVPDSVEITGWLPREEVLRRMAGCHLYMQTSLWEGLPIALLEGMVLGLAVLACPAVGNTELVIEGANGFLCPDAVSFIARIQALDADRAALGAMGEASRDLALRHHSVGHIAPRWLSLYRHYDRYRRFG
ncbi:MAG: glycosyltransferase [Rhodospirillaceae bacterium]